MATNESQLVACSPPWLKEITSGQLSENTGAPASDKYELTRHALPRIQFQTSDTVIPGTSSLDVHCM